MFLGLLLSVAARGGDVTVIRSDSRSVQIEYRARYFEPRPVVSAGVQYTMMDFEGGQSVGAGEYSPGDRGRLRGYAEHGRGPCPDNAQE
jgi:hypothetical protein